MSVSYELVTRSPGAKERVHQYASNEPLSPGEVLKLGGRFWLVERIDEPDGASELPRAIAKPARYRLRLRYPDAREELGALRRFRAGSPRLGHGLTTMEAGQPISWQVVEEQLARDDGQPFLELIAERDYAEADRELPDHELEHALERERDEGRPSGAETAIARAAEEGLDVELVALEPGEEPDWAESLRYIDALIFEEIEDDLFEQCGVDVDHDRRETWLGIVKERLRADLEAFRSDVEGDHDEIEEWEFRGGRIFASVGTYEDEFDPLSGHGWMCRLTDSGALGVAGFERVRKYELEVESPD